MKVFFFLGALALVAACDRPAAAPTAAGARAVTGTVELRVGSLVQQYDLRVDKAPAGFIALLRPIAGQTPTALATSLAGRLARVPFVRDSTALPGNPVLVETPVGVLSATIVYRPLGAWQVLDHVDATLGDRTTPAFHLALHEPRLEP
jgi:hypothetical protein